MRVLICALVLAGLLVGGSAAAQPTLSLAAAPSPGSDGPLLFEPPVAGLLHVLRPFQPPPSPYAAGHRGVDVSVAVGSVVRAAADGTVTFAGDVAGRGVVVIAHRNGIRTEYEPLRPTVSAGSVLRRGAAIGLLSGLHAGCPSTCLHWGARHEEIYFDPLSLLRRLGVVRLVPWAHPPG